MAVRSILAFEPWDGGSHASVRQSINRWSRHRWTWCTLPARGWRWRMRTGAWTLAERAAEHPDRPDAEPFDAVFASGLLSLPDLLSGLARTLPAASFSAPWPPPSIVLMHENQAAYPSGPGGEDARDAHLILTNLATVLAADAVLWNSAWNRRSFVDGLSAVRRADPDPPAMGAPDSIERLGKVLWPPVEPWDGTHSAGGLEGTTALSSSSAPAADEDIARVVWPHRWEHDKGPDELLALARTHRDRASGPRLRWILLGERFRRIPEAMTTFRREFEADIEHDGWIADHAAYRSRLASADWVLSTARHEFFGIAVVEALLAGCLPWLPDRLSYPELVPLEARGLDPASPPEPDAAVSLRAAIRRHLEPALAPNAVASLDDHLERTVTVGRSRTGHAREHPRCGTRSEPNPGSGPAPPSPGRPDPKVR